MSKENSKGITAEDVAANLSLLYATLQVLVFLEAMYTLPPDPDITMIKRMVATIERSQPTETVLTE